VLQLHAGYDSLFEHFFRHCSSYQFSQGVESGTRYAKRSSRLEYVASSSRMVIATKPVSEAQF
jgi:hypothetical protein